MKRGIAELADTDLRAHTLWLGRLAARLLRDSPRAEDAVQDTLVAALEHPPALDRDVRPWLARVLANLTVSGRRADERRRRREARAAIEPGDAAPSAEELLERHEAARVVADLVSGLREPHRGLVLLRFAEGLTSKDIARRRGVPEGTVRRQLKEALDEMRATMAAHYGRGARNWRMALGPLLRFGEQDGAPAGAWKGMVLMTAKKKAALGLAASLVVLALLAVGLRWGFTPTEVADRDPSGALKAEAARQGEGESVVARRIHPAGAADPPTTITPGAGPPNFVMGAATGDPPGCQEKLAELRSMASKLAVSPAVFESATPSPNTEARVAPIVAEALSRMAGTPSYQLECRVSVCRVGGVTDPEGRPQPPAWLQALSRDATLGALRGQNRSARLESVPTRDALSGAELLQHWLYFNVPLDRGDAHPLEGDTSSTSCGERLATLRKALGEHQEESGRRRAEEQELARKFETLPANPELTRRVAAAFRAITHEEPGGPTGWQCRGEGECRWRGPSSTARSFAKARIDEVLARQNLSASRVMARLRAERADEASAEAELHLRLGDGHEGRDDGVENPAQPRAQILMERVFTESAPE